MADWRFCFVQESGLQHRSEGSPLLFHPLVAEIPGKLKFPQLGLITFDLVSWFNIVVPLKVYNASQNATTINNGYDDSAYSSDMDGNFTIADGFK
jgi:hypothetical protein